MSDRASPAEQRHAMGLSSSRNPRLQPWFATTPRVPEHVQSIESTIAALSKSVGRQQAAVGTFVFQSLRDFRLVVDGTGKGV